MELLIEFTVLCVIIFSQLCNRQLRLFEDSFNGECKLVLGGLLASRIDTEKRPNELEKLNELLFAQVLSSSRQPQCAYTELQPRTPFSRQTGVTLGTFPHSQADTTSCKLPSPAASTCKSPLPGFLFTFSAVIFPRIHNLGRKVQSLNPFCRPI